MLLAVRRKRVWMPAGAIALWLIAWFVLPFALQLPPSLAAGPAASPVLRDRHGEPLRHLVLPDFTRSSPVSLQEVPQDLIDCTIAAEDKRFWKHGGIDLLATLRAATDAIRHRQLVSGASTLTQQLIKLSSPPAPRSFPTKIREALLARRLEMTWTKDRILTAYLNRLPYGNHRTGPREAARFYFQKPLSDLSLGECALLAGLPQAPSRLNPLRHPERALARRQLVLQRRARLPDRSLSRTRLRAAGSESLALRPLLESTTAPWLINANPENADGSLPRLTLDAALQRDVEAIVREELVPLRAANVQHAAVVILNNHTREILALVNSGDWNNPVGGEINGARIPRSPGSALKPFTWLLAFERAGYHPGTIVADVPTRFRTGEGLDMPSNYDNTFRGPVTVRQALGCSLNVPAMRVLNEIGGPRILKDLMAVLDFHDLDPDPLAYGLGITIGTAPVSLLDLTNAYATLARGGEHGSPTLVLGGNFTNHSAPTPPPAFSRRAAFMIADILADPSARSASFGRASPLNLPFRCAAKTGTSSDFRDNWCLGFTADFTVGVWAGNFDHSPMKGVSGVAGAGPIFHRAMLRAQRDSAPGWQTRPPGLIDLHLDPLTGFPAAEGRLEILPADLRPPLGIGSAGRDHHGKIILGPEFAEWFRSDQNRHRNQFVLAADQPTAIPLRILAPAAGATYVLDPELPNGGILHLASNLPGLIEWSCATLELRHGSGEPSVRLRPGTHTITALDPTTHSQQEVTIQVIDH